MAEYIEREALLNRLKTKVKQITPIEESRDMFYHDSGANGALTRAMLEAENAPAAEVVPVVHSHWVHDINNLYGCYVCMNRETMSPKKLKPYCPNCGARMDGE